MLSIHYCTGVKQCQGRCYNRKLVECKMCDLSSDYAPY